MENKKRSRSGFSGGDNPRAKPCLINDKIFECVKHAGEYVGVQVKIINQRINSPSYPNYQWIEKNRHD